MVNSPRWVMYRDDLCRVVRQINKDTLRIQHGVELTWDNNTLQYRYKMGHSIIKLESCTPITDEVATVMIGSM